MVVSPGFEPRSGMGWPWAAGTLRTYDGDAVFLPDSLTGERTHAHLMHFSPLGGESVPDPSGHPTCPSDPKS